MMGNTEDESLAKVAVSKLSAILGVIARGLLDWRVVLSGIWAFALVYLGWVYLLPPGDRIKASPDTVASAIARIIESSVYMIAGWATAASILLVAAVVISIQHKRIKRQGKELVKLRDKIDPQRLSAGDRERLMDYAQGKASTPKGEPS